MTGRQFSFLASGAEAKALANQSGASCSTLDCFVASLLAMTKEGVT
jgi:hypothetical protein